jgi:flavin-dependent dehydrogenase
MTADVLILGAGPAGTSTAITCAQAGLRVVLTERSAFPRHMPGETLHPGVEPLLARLGVADAVHNAGFVRHAGHWITWAGPPRFEPFGGDASGSWLGFQAWRPTFDALLLDRARRLGTHVLQPCHVLQPLYSGGRVVGVATDEGPLAARFVVDATGRRRWLSEQLRIDTTRRGPRLVAWYGYVEGHCPDRDDAPAIIADAAGWTWTARVRPRTYQWTRLSFDFYRPAGDWRPTEFSELTPLGATRGADVTWRVATLPAGSGYFLVGDAAAVLDPASSHGVLKALMSGMMAGHLIARSVRHGASELRGALAYNEWLHQWFEHDVRRLSGLYARLPVQPSSRPARRAPVSRRNALQSLSPEIQLPERNTRA